MDSSVWLEIQSALDLVYALVWPMAAALAGVGTATMAAFQMFKDLFHVRRWFNRCYVREWLRLRAGERAAAVEGSLLRLATAGEADALYSLEGDRLAGQINAAARMALDWPAGHEVLIHCLASEAGTADLQAAVSPPPPTPPSASEDEKSRARDRAAVYLEAKNRVAAHIQRTLDGFQIRLEYDWKRWNQAWAFGLNFGFVMVVLVVNSYRAGGYRTETPAYALVAILGGFVAPLAKDLVSALEALKGRPR